MIPIAFTWTAKAKALKTLYDHNIIDKAKLQTAVEMNLITHEAYKEICGEDYGA